MRQVSHTTLGASKNVKFLLSHNSTKFDVVDRFHETIPTVKSVSLSEIKKIYSNFDRNYHSTLLSNFPRFHMRTQRLVAASCRSVVSQCCIATLLRRIATPKVAPCHDIKIVS